MDYSLVEHQSDCVCVIQNPVQKCQRRIFLSKSLVFCYFLFLLVPLTVRLVETSNRVKLSLRSNVRKWEKMILTRKLFCLSHGAFDKVEKFGHVSENHVMGGVALEAVLNSHTDRNQASDLPHGVRFV